MVRIADYAAQKDLRRAGDIRQPLGDQSAGTALRRRQRQSPFPAQRQHRLLQSGHVRAVEIRAQPGPYLRQHRHHPRLTGTLVRPAGGQLQHHLARLGIGCQRHVRLPPQQVAQQLLHLRLRQAEDMQRV